jgi:rieske iron-sulfur protein
MNHQILPPCACACCASDKDQPRDPARRTMLTGALALSALAIPGVALAQATPVRKPEVGDKLAFMLGDRKDQEVKPDDVQVGAEPVLAYPLSPDGKVLLAKANLLTVVRLTPDQLKPSSAKNAADGIVAFSSLCTHYGCPITTLHPDKTKIVCNCHGSIFDATDRGAVAQGPATRRLAMLPLTLTDGAIVVAGKFDGPLGPPTS